MGEGGGHKRLCDYANVFNLTNIVVLGDVLPLPGHGAGGYQCSVQDKTAAGTPGGEDAGGADRGGEGGDHQAGGCWGGHLAHLL